MPKDKKEHSVQSASVARVNFQQQYVGPVPPPAIMEKMEAVLPGAADRIFTMAEKDQDAQNAFYKTREANTHNEAITALWMAFIICIVFTLCGTTLVLQGYVKTGAVLLGTTLTGVVGSFLYRRRVQPLTSQTHPPKK